MDQNFGIGGYEKYTKPNKVWGSKMGVSKHLLNHTNIKSHN